MVNLRMDVIIKNMGEERNRLLIHMYITYAKLDAWQRTYYCDGLRNMVNLFINVDLTFIMNVICL